MSLVALLMMMSTTTPMRAMMRALKTSPTWREGGWSHLRPAAVGGPVVGPWLGVARGRSFWTIGTWRFSPHKRAGHHLVRLDDRTPQLGRSCPLT